ncbi:MAG: hypothetical protein AMXMBFR79_05610 [Chitinophagaceae bacterium]
MQINYFIQDVKRMLGKHKIRILHIWLSRAYCGIFIYRLERNLYLLLGEPYGVVRIIFIPILNIFYAYSNIEINYKANIKGGILVLHPAVGVVISGLSVIGSNITLTGGNIIGARKGCKKGDIIIGNNCELGANAVILGPVEITNNVSIGASACVVKNCTTDGAALIGVPAKETSTK